MTVYFDVDGIDFYASGVNHERSGTFIVQGIYLRGTSVNLKKILDEDFCERVEVAASEAAQSPAGGAFYEPRIGRSPRLPIELPEEEIEAMR